MAEEIKTLLFNVQVEDNTATGWDQAVKNSKRNSKKIKEATAGMVSEKAGKAMGQFNEKTEKARQLTTAFGGAVGGAAGNVIYYAGTLSYVVGRFSLMELGIMAVVGAIGALVWVLTQETEAQKAAREATEKHVKTMRELNEELAKQMALASGMSGARWEFEMAYEQLEALEALEANAIENISALQLKSVDEHWESVHGGMDRLLAAEEHLANVRRARQETETKAQLAQIKVDTAVKVQQAKDEADAKKKAERRARKQTKDSGIGFDPEQLAARHFEAFMANRKRALAKLQSLEIQASRGVVAIRMRQAARVAAVMDDEYLTELEQQQAIEAIHRDTQDRLWEYERSRFEKAARARAKDARDAEALEADRLREQEDAERAKQAMWAASAGAVQKLGSAVSMAMELAGSSEEAQMRAVAVFTAIVDTINGAHETAEAIAAFASYRYSEGAQHTAAAAAYFVSAALAAAQAGGAVSAGGRGGGAVQGGSSGPNYQERRSLERDNERGQGGGTTIIVDGNLYNGRSTFSEIRKGLEELDFAENPNKPRRKVA